MSVSRGQTSRLLDQIGPVGRFGEKLGPFTKHKNAKKGPEKCVLKAIAFNEIQTPFVFVGKSDWSMNPGTLRW